MEIEQINGKNINFKAEDIKHDKSVQLAQVDK